MDLKQEVIKELGRRRGQWKRIAGHLAPDVSYSFISKLGRDQYPNDPTHKRLTKLADFLCIK